VSMTMCRYPNKDICPYNCFGESPPVAGRLQIGKTSACPPCLSCQFQASAGRFMLKGGG
jgi:hypothetical protein